MMHLELIGSGPQDVVLLHYFGGSGGYWKAMIDALPRDRFRFIVPDLPGFGQSADFLPKSSVPEKADALKALLEAHSATKCLVAGHSMGGKIAMALAAAAPEYVAGLALFAPSPPSPEPISFSDRKKLRDMYGDGPELRKHVKSICSVSLPERVLDGLVAANCEAAQVAWIGWLESGSREDISDRIRSLNLPVRICYGADDALITGQLLKATVSNRFPDASLISIAGCGHLLPVEKPAETAREILALVRALR